MILILFLFYSELQYHYYFVKYFYLAIFIIIVINYYYYRHRPNCPALQASSKSGVFFLLHFKKRNNFLMRKIGLIFIPKILSAALQDVSICLYFYFSKGITRETS